MQFVGLNSVIVCLLQPCAGDFWRCGEMGGSSVGVAGRTFGLATVAMNRTIGLCFFGPFPEQSQARGSHGGSDVGRSGWSPNPGSKSMEICLFCTSGLQYAGSCSEPIETEFKRGACSACSGAGSGPWCDIGSQQSSGPSLVARDASASKRAASDTYPKLQKRRA